VRAASWALAMIAALGALAACGSGAGSLQGRKPPGPDYVGNVTLPEVRLGRPDSAFSLRAEPDGFLFVYFGYANCPDICPTTLADFRRALQRVGPDARRVRLAFITVDPYRDSAAVLVPYLESFAHGAHALAPRDPEQLSRAETAFGATSAAARTAGGGVEVSHTAVSYLVDARGRIVVQWDFGTSPKTMAHDLRLLLRPAHGAPS
jgi:protein SCO1/2